MLMYIFPYFSFSLCPLGTYVQAYVPEGGKLCITAGDRREPADRAPDYKTVLEEGELSMQNAM